MTRIVDGQMALAVALGDGQHLGLRAVALLALDVAEGGLGQHGRVAGEEAVAGVDLVSRVAGDDEEGDALADLGDPVGLVVEARRRWWSWRGYPRGGRIPCW